MLVHLYNFAFIFDYASFSPPYKQSIRTWSKGDLRDFECVMIEYFRKWLFSHTTISNRMKTENIQRATVMWAEMASWCQLKGEQADWLEMRESSSNNHSLQTNYAHKRRPHGVWLLSAKTKKLRLQITRAQQTFTKLTELQSPAGTTDSHHELTVLQQLHVAFVSK